MLNKKAQTGYATIWLYRFLLLVLIVGGIVGIVFMHYSRQYDVRSVESAILSRKIVDCLSKDGRINETEFNEKNFRDCIKINNDIYLNISFNDQNFSLGDKLLLRNKLQIL